MTTMGLSPYFPKRIIVRVFSFASLIAHLSTTAFTTFIENYVLGAILISLILWASSEVKHINAPVIYTGRKLKGYGYWIASSIFFNLRVSLVYDR
jgi:hypothetical protein